MRAGTLTRSWRCRRCRSTCTCRGACASARTATSIRTRCRRAERSTPRPNPVTSTPLIADLEASLPFVWSRRVQTDLHRRRHTEPVRARGDRAPDRRRCAPACRSSRAARSRSKANPGHLRARPISAPIAAAGVTRLSIGVQSFDDGTWPHSAASTMPRRRAPPSRKHRPRSRRSTSTSCTRSPASRSKPARPTSPPRCRSRRRTCRSTT